MLQKKWIVVAVLTVPLVTLCFAIVQRGRGTHPADSPALPAAPLALEAVRVSPPSETGDDVECSSFAEVDFTYRIVNHGQRPIAGLKLGTTCACEAIGSPPAEIAPGESGLVSFRLRAPYVGRLQRQIPLLVEGSQEPLLVLDAALRVKFDPPALIPTSQDLTLSFVQGDDSPRELVLETIESKPSEPWITGLEWNPSDRIDIRAPRVEDLIEPDPGLTRRRYRFPLANRSLDVGQHSVSVTVRTRQDDAKPPPAFSLKVAVVDTVAIVPNPLVIKFQPGSQPDARQVHVVDRTSGQTSIRGIKCDENVLQVRATAQQRGSAQAFEVIPVRTSETPFETPVVFDIGNGQTRELLVRFEPSKSP